MKTRLPVLLARVRMPLFLGGFLLLWSGNFYANDAVHWAGVVLTPVGLVLLFVSPRSKVREPIAVRSPVRGRWVAINSPADRVPSHGTHELGQTYAIDLVFWQDRAAWKSLHWWPPVRRPQTFPAFGRPVHAPADGVVVRASGWQRDHWSRNSWPTVVFLIFEGIARSILSLLTFSGGRFVLGNHVILDLGDGVYAAYAHLRRGSLQVGRGQRVTAGQRIAECGNSGNSSEPHLHFQLMDHPWVLVAAGLPFTFGYETDGEPRQGVPRNKEPFTVPDISDRTLTAT